MGALNIKEGDTICQALQNLNTLLQDIIMTTPDIPTFTYTLRCAPTADTDVSISVLTKDGVSQIMSSTQFPNGPSALAFLQTVDPDWTFTAPNIYSIHSAHVWTLTMGCPA